MTLTTLTYNGMEKSLADWGISSWGRVVQNQGEDSISLTIPTPMDGSSIFPYGANVIIRINRVAASVNRINPTLPPAGGTDFSGGQQWFWGYCIDENRVGEPGREEFQYKFVGPFQFFFERLVFQKFQLTWNGAKQIVDWQSDVILGLSLTRLTGSGDTVQSSTATNLMSVAQQVKEICMYAQNDSAYQHANNGLAWPSTAVSGQPANAQFRCDQLTANIDQVNWDLLPTPSTNVLISDYAGTALSGKTSASALPAGSYILRPPLDAMNAITCKEAMQRMLQWLGGVGSPVVWTDHSQSPPQLRIATRAQLNAADPGATTTLQRMTGGYKLNLPLSGITVKNRIKKRSDLIPTAIHFKYKVSGDFLGQPYSTIINDVATSIGGVPKEGIGQLGSLTDLAGAAISAPDNNTFMAQAKTAASIVQTLNFQGENVNAQKAIVTTVALPLSNGALSDPLGGGSALAFWQQLFPELGNASGVAFFDAVNFPATVTDAVTNTPINLATYKNWLQKGQFFPWMPGPGSTSQSPVPGSAAKVKITAHFTYQEQAKEGANTAPTGKVARVEKNIVLTLTNVATGGNAQTFYSVASVSSGEPIPYGLAGYIYALESIPQYEGSILVQEQEISDVCPVGNTLNITGGLGEWATMQACVQSVRYSDSGQTEITFGPARHLGTTQFVKRLQTNIGPRWYNLIAGDPMNQNNPGAAAEATQGQAQSPSDGSKDYSFKSFHTGLDSILGGAVPTLPGGVHLDSGAVNTPFTSGVPSGVAPFAKGAAIVIAAGSQPVNGTPQPGETRNWIRLSLADIIGITPRQIYLQELPVCVNNGSGNLVSMKQLFLCSAPYT